MPITASQLYDHVSCPRRVALDVHGDAARRDEVSPFVRMLWDRGASFERQTLAHLGADAVAVTEAGDRIAATAAAMDRGAAVIVGGRIAADDLLGEPDLLIRSQGGYMPADVKSGRGEEGDGAEARPKPHYAVQFGLYVDVLERIGRSAGRGGEIWDIRGDRVPYPLDDLRGPKATETWWHLYERSRDDVRGIVAETIPTRGALSATCGLCHWRTVCRVELEAASDLTLIPALGRSLRDRMAPVLGGVHDFARADPEIFVSGNRTMFAGLGADRLRLFHARAKLLTEPGATAYLRAPLTLPDEVHEIFFDIEADPMDDVVYLHGFIERFGRDPATETFTGVFADEPGLKGERRAFAEAMAYLAARPDATVWYYSKYERTAYRRLQARHPGVCRPDDVDALFTPPRSVDLYCDVVAKATEWPVRNHSIKTLAKHLGFSWRDPDPSGAASIEWYRRWVETGDPSIRQRILDYNEDDCRATAVVLDGVRKLRARPSGF